MVDNNIFSDLIPGSGEKTTKTEEQNMFSDLVPSQGQKPEKTLGGYARAAYDQYYQGLSGNYSDEAQDPLGALYATAREQPMALFGEEMNPALAESISGAYDTTRDRLKQQRQDYPEVAIPAHIAGTLTSAAIGAKTLPRVASGLQALPWWASVPAVGAATNAIYNTGDAKTGERINAGINALVPGAAWGLGGFGALKAGQALARPVQQKVGPITQKVTQYLGRKKQQLQPTTTSDKIRLPTGVEKGNVNMMRAEEAGRQGLLGDEFQGMMQQVDDTVRNDATGIVNRIAGRDGSSSDLLESGIDTVKRRAGLEKKMASNLMKARNDALAKTRIYKEYVRENLGNDLAELVSDPQNRPFLATQGSKEVMERLNYLSDVLERKGDDIGFDELSGWYSDLSTYARANKKKPEGVFANKVAEKYRGWLDGIARHAIKEGDDEVVDKIFKANSKYAEFKSKYGTNKFSGQSKILNDIVEKDELTADHLVNMTFGKTLNGNNTTNQVTKRMIESIPEGSKREALVGDLKAGLLKRSLEMSEKNGEVSLAKLQTNLKTLRGNRAFRDNLANPNDINIINDLIDDLGKYVDATTRRDVYSPSGPAILRGLGGLLDIFGTISSPLGGRAITEPIKQAIRQGKLAPDRNMVEKSVNMFNNSLKEAVEGNAKIYGAVGGASAGSETQQ